MPVLPAKNEFGPGQPFYSWFAGRWRAGGMVAVAVEIVQQTNDGQRGNAPDQERDLDIGCKTEKTGPEGKEDQ